MKRSVFTVICLVATGFSSVACTEADEDCVGDPGGGASSEPADDMPRLLEEKDRIVSPEVRAYFEERHQQMEIVATTTTRRGSTYDWIYPESQVPGGVLATPPPPDAGDTSEDAETCKPRVALTELEEEGVVGPPGTVPVLRVELDRIHAPGSVEDFLSRYGSASDLPTYPASEDLVLPQVSAPEKHYYAMTFMQETTYGAEASISVWAPVVIAPTETSIAQIGVTSGLKSKGDLPTETVEAGWHVYAALHGDFATRFFVFFNTNKYSEIGDLKGGYNIRQSGWVQVSKKITPGAILSPVSVVGGTQRAIRVRIFLHEKNWWVKLEDEMIGYYPASLFAADGLAAKATTVHFFGETSDDPNIPGTTDTDMGSGKLPGLYTSRGNAAFMRKLNILKGPSPGESYWLRYSSSTGHPLKHAPDPKCYDIILNLDAQDSSENEIYFGGEGQSKTCP